MTDNVHHINTEKQKSVILRSERKDGSSVYLEYDPEIMCGYRIGFRETNQNLFTRSEDY